MHASLALYTRQMTKIHNIGRYDDLISSCMMSDMSSDIESINRHTSRRLHCCLDRWLLLHSWINVGTDRGAVIRYFVTSRHTIISKCASNILWSVWHNKREGSNKYDQRSKNFTMLRIFQKASGKKFYEAYYGIVYSEQYRSH